MKRLIVVGRISMSLVLGAATVACSKADSKRSSAESTTQLPDKPRSGLEVSITSVDATSYQLGTDALAAAMLEGLAGDVRVAASTGGYRIVALRTGSVLARAGLLTGDIVSKIGNVELRGADSLFTAYQAARGGSFEVELMRGRDSVRLRYLVRGSAPDFGMAGLLPRPAPAPTLSVGPTALPGFTVTSVSPELIELTVDRAEFDKVLADADALARGARIVPSMKNGFPNGLKLYGIRAGSLFHAAGFSNGDTINSVNGDTITSADSGLAIYAKVKAADKLRVEITRRGAAVTLIYTIK